MFTVGLGLLGATVDHHDLPEHGVGDPHRLRVRRFAARAVPPRRRRHLHQGGRRRRRPRRQGRSRASPRTTPATRPPSPTTWATTSATARAWPPTCSRATRSPWSRRSSSASPRSSRSASNPSAARAHLPARRPRHRRARLDRAACSRCAPPTRTSRRMAPINRGFITAGVLTVVGTARRGPRLRRQRRVPSDAGWNASAR